MAARYHHCIGQRWSAPRLHEQHHLQYKNAMAFPLANHPMTSLKAKLQQHIIACAIPQSPRATNSPPQCHPNATARSDQFFARSDLAQPHRFFDT